jgi:hypothetical protein
MQKNAYLLLLILTIFALLSGIAAELLNRNNPALWSLIAIWIILYLLGAGAQRSTFPWSQWNILELFCGMALIHSSAQVIQNLALLPAVIALFAGATYLASLKFKRDEQ